MKDINSEDTLQFNPPTIKIGNQLWMTENLAYDDGEGGITYNPDNKEYYYTWDAAMRIAKKLGWKLPSAEDWNKAAEECVDTCTNPEEGNLKSKLKVKLTGFYYISFEEVGSRTYFWTSSEYPNSVTYAYRRYFSTSSMNLNFSSKNCHYSVRLIKEI